MKARSASVQTHIAQRCDVGTKRPRGRDRQAVPWPASAQARQTIGERKPQPDGCLSEALVIGRYGNAHTLAAQEVHACQVQRSLRSHRRQKGQQRATEHGLGHLKQIHPIHQLAGIDGVRSSVGAGMHTIEDFELEQTAGDQGLRPERVGRRAVLGEQARKGRPSCPDRSTFSPAVVKVAQHLGNGRQWPAARQPLLGRNLRGRQQALPHQLAQTLLGRRRIVAHAWRYQLSHDPAAVGHEHGFASGRRANVLAEPILQGLDANA